MDDLNQKQISTLEFMAHYGSLGFLINDGRIIGYETKESPAPASKQD